VGQSKQRTRSLLKLQPICCFCGGTTPATTIDHQPARALFDRKEWPEGYEFPACDPCNQRSKGSENALALLVRINSDREDDPQRRSDFQKYLLAMRNNFPGLLRPLSTREKRQFFKSENLAKPAAGIAGLHMAGTSAEAAERTIDTVVQKVLRALHYKHTGKIAPIGDQIVFMRWFTNAYVHQLEHESYAPFLSLPARPPMVRNGRDLSDQFSYRYGVDDDRDVSAFFLRFRLSLIAIGLVVQSSDLIPADAA
jgi:hypothetical protein